MTAITSHNQTFNHITEPMGDELTWRWQDDDELLLCDFSWEKQERVLAQLQQLFTDQWHYKTVKYLPAEIKQDLGKLATLNKKQLLFTQPGNGEQPAIAAALWPWGHGATYSIRLKVLAHDYDSNTINRTPTSAIAKLLSLFTGSK